MSSSSSRICLSYDDHFIYALSAENVASYDIQHGTVTTSTKTGALTETSQFNTCFSHQNQLYVSLTERTGSLFFRTFVITTIQQQLQVEMGSQTFAAPLASQDQFNLSSVASTVPMFLKLPKMNNDSSTVVGDPASSAQELVQQPCVIFSAANVDGNGNNGLYRLCNKYSYALQPLPFSDSPSSVPLLAPNNAFSSITLLGYPHAKAISVYNKLDDFSQPTASYNIDVPIPAQGSVQVLDDAASEFIIYDFNRTVLHIQLPDLQQQQQQQQHMKRGIPAHNYSIYQLTDDLQNGNVIALPDRRVFTLSNKYANQYTFAEIPLLVPSTNKPGQPSSSAPTSSSNGDTKSALSDQTKYIIIGVASAVGACLILFLFWFLYRRKRRGQQYVSPDPEEDEEAKHDALPLYTLRDSGEGNASSVGIIAHQQQHYHHHRGDDDHHNLRNIDTNRSASGESRQQPSLRRGFTTILDRMASLRSAPQSPSSIFSFFSNISSSAPTPVQDKFHKVKQVSFPAGASDLMEPTLKDGNGTLILNARYQLLDEQPLFDDNTRIPGYTTRTIEHALKENTVRTLHYYPKEQSDAFLRNLNASVALRSSSRLIRHHDAIALTAPTRQGYQYFWISSLCVTQQSLHYLVHTKKEEEDSAVVVDTRQFNFLALSVLSLLSCMRDVHAADYCHLGLSLRSFFYQQASAITDWYVGGFDQAHIVGQPEGYALKLNTYSAPELLIAATTQRQATLIDSSASNSSSNRRQQQQVNSGHYCYQFSPRQSLDAWSMGCVIYELATGKPLFGDMRQAIRLAKRHSALEAHLQQAYDHMDFVHPSFRGCVEALLQIDPLERHSIQQVLTRWVETNHLDEEQDDLE